MKVEFIYSPREIFIPFHQRDKRWTCLVAHRRAGKTVAAVNDLLVGSLGCRKPRPQFAYIAPFRDQAKRVAWHYLKYYAAPFLARINEAELTVTTVNGGVIMLLGSDNADALRGIYLDGAVLDEFGDFKPSVWGNVIRPALSERSGWGVFSGTPKGRNEFWERREEARKNPLEWLLMELRASEVKLSRKAEVREGDFVLTWEEYEELKRTLLPEQIAQEYECDFSAALVGAYYGKEMVQCERDGRLGHVEYDPELPCFTAWDIGYRDDTAIWWYQVARGEIHVIDHHASSGQSVEFYAKVVAEKGYDVKRHWLPKDAKAKTLGAAGRSVVEQLAAHLGGLGSLAIVPNLGVQDGIQAARVALKRCWFDESRCEEGLEALRQYQREYDEDKKAFRETPRHDWTSHSADAFRYLALSWKAEVQAAPAPKGKTIHDVTLDELYEWHKQLNSETRRI